MTPGLAIFDCDGVLVDSEAIAVDVLVGTIAEAGVRMSRDEAYSRLLGRSMASVVAILDGEFGVSLADDDLARMRRRLLDRFRHDLKPVPGVADAIRRGGWRRCVASSSQPERIRLSLDVTGLLPLFEPHIFSAAMVPRGKPEPDLFLHAAQRMGARPAECVVIEDSPAGIRAARRAGMKVVAFVGGTHAGPAGLAEAASRAGPDTIIEDMRDLPEAVESLA